MTKVYSFQTNNIISQLLISEIRLSCASLNQWYFKSRNSGVWYGVKIILDFRVTGKRLISFYATTLKADTSLNINIVYQCKRQTCRYLADNELIKIKRGMGVAANRHSLFAACPNSPSLIHIYFPCLSLWFFFGLSCSFSRAWKVTKATKCPKNKHDSYNVN